MRATEKVSVKFSVKFVTARNCVLFSFWSENGISVPKRDGQRLQNDYRSFFGQLRSKAEKNIFVENSVENVKNTQFSTMMCVENPAPFNNSTIYFPV